MEAKNFRVVTHHRPDNDELVATRIIELWGGNEFPGVSGNPLITVDAGLTMSAEQIRKWLDGGHILVGTGGQLVTFDEHGKGDGVSAATFAAAHYKLTDDPALQRILAYSLRADDKAEDHPFAMASVIKTLHSAGVPLEKVRAMHRGWFDALYMLDSGELTFGDNRSTFRQMAVAWLVSVYGRPQHRDLVFGTFADAMEAIGLTPEQADEVREIQRFTDRDLTKNPYSNFDIGGLVQVLQAADASESYIINDVRTVLSAKVHRQREFMAARKYFLENAAYPENCQLRVAVVLSDNEQMHRAARSGNSKLVALVQQRSSGHIQIFSDQKRDLRPIVRRLRALEYRKAGHRSELSFTALSSAGTHHLVPEWYAFEKYGKVLHVFNGTLKTRQTRKTRLTLNEVVDCVREGMAHTHRARGENRDRSKVTTA